MIDFEVRHLATSFGGSRAAAAAFGRTVSIWDLQKNEHVSTFQTDLDFGGRRIVVNEQGTLCAAAAYTRHGLGCYDAGTGSLVWARRDLKQLQHLSVSRDATRLYCGSEIACAVLDFGTGQSLDFLGGVRRVVEGRYQPILFLDQAPAAMRRMDTGALLPEPRLRSWMPRLVRTCCVYPRVEVRFALSTRRRVARSGDMSNPLGAMRCGSSTSSPKTRSRSSSARLPRQGALVHWLC